MVFRSLRGISCLLVLLLLPPRATHAGANRAGRAWLSWGRVGTKRALSPAPHVAFPLFLHLRDAPDIRALTASAIWLTGDSMSCGYQLISSGVDPDLAPDSLNDSATDGALPQAIGRDSTFEWMTSFRSPSAKLNCVAYFVSKSACDGITRATL